MDEIQPFITLEKTVHIFRLLAENMNYFPDYDKDTEDTLALTTMIGYVQKNYSQKLCLKIFHPQEIAARQNALPFFRNI